MYATNITPYGIRFWTDGELYRLITTGVNKNGDPIHPIMPYHNYSKLRRYDVKAIIGYLRTLRSIKNDVPKSNISFPHNLVLRTMPKPAKGFSPNTRYEEGEYLANVAGCISCHTPYTNGKPDTKRLLQGGREFILPNGDNVLSSNITSNPNSGIGRWSKKYFIDTFNKYNVPKDALRKPEGKNTVMPWTQFTGLKAKDLSAIYDYLMSVQ